MTAIRESRLRAERRWPVISLLLGFLLAGAALVLYATANGIGVSPDSVIYIASAKSALNGDGFRIPYGSPGGTPLTHFPPFYPVLLAAAGLVGVNALDAARLLDAVLFGATAAITAFIVFRVTSGNLLAAGLAGCFILPSVPLLSVSASAWTEPVFIVLSLAGLYLLSVHLTERRLKPLVLSAICVALALVTRYAAFALLGTGVIGILLLSRGTGRARIGNALVWGLVATIPFLLWVFRNMTVTNGATDRALSYHPVALSDIKRALNLILHWVLPGFHTRTIMEFIGIAALIILLYIIRRSSVFAYWRKIPAFVWLCAIFLVVYSVFLVVSISYFDAAIPLDDRILSPLYSVLVIFVSVLIAQAVQMAKPGRLERILFLLPIFLVLMIHGDTGAKWIGDRHPVGNGYNSGRWHRSQTIAALGELPEDITAFSNRPDAVYFLTGRQLLSIPMKTDPHSLKDDPRYDSELAQLRQSLEEGGVLVYFGSAGPLYVPSRSELLAELPLKPVAVTNDGAIYSFDETH